MWSQTFGPACTLENVLGTCGRLQSRHVDLFWRHSVFNITNEGAWRIRSTLTRQTFYNDFRDWKHFNIDYFEMPENVNRIISFVVVNGTACCQVGNVSVALVLVFYIYIFVIVRYASSLCTWNKPVFEGKKWQVWKVFAPPVQKASLFDTEPKIFSGLRVIKQSYLGLTVFSNRSDINMQFL